MSYSLLLENGDLAMRGKTLGLVYGMDKLVQDLTIWLTEGFGSDIMHPELGSFLDSWIGQIITESTEAEVRQEILRVLQNYSDNQVRGLKNNPQKYSLSEVLFEIDDIGISFSYDTVSVTISVSTAPPESKVGTFIIKASANYGKGA
jgi:phage baseplate assembly protein W